MKKILILLSALTLLCACTPKENLTSNDKINITATIFPQYDFSRQISQDLANVDMLLPAGAESHTYEPTPKDILKINNSDIFIYTGGESDAWIEDILSGIDNPNLRLVCLADICPVSEEEHSHDHNAHTIDEHFWTSPKNVLLISEEIKNILSEIDSKNALQYEKNFEEYKKELDELDDEFTQIAETSKRKLLVFGDRFPFKYLTEEYGFEYISAFPGCAEETEPDIKTVKELIDRVKNENIPIVFYTDFSNHKIADTISEETGAKISMLRSCHTLTAEELKNNVTYIDLMRQNAAAIKEALN